MSSGQKTAKGFRPEYLLPCCTPTARHSRIAAKAAQLGRRRRRSFARPPTAVPPLLHIRRSAVVAVGHRRRQISTPHHHRRANCTSQPPQLEHSWSAPTGAPPLRPPLARAPWPRSPRPAHLLRAHTSPSRGIGQPKHAHSRRRGRPAAPTGAGRSPGRLDRAPRRRGSRIRSPTSPATTGRRPRRRALSRGLLPRVRWLAASGQGTARGATSTPKQARRRAVRQSLQHALRPSLGPRPCSPSRRVPSHSLSEN